MEEASKSNEIHANKEDPGLQEVENTASGSDNSGGNGDHMKRTETEMSYVHETMNLRLFLALTAMAFLWVGSQIPLFLFGSVIARIYSDIGGVDRWVWFVVGYLIPNAALCPFVGALSDMFGRRYVAIFGQVMLIVGPIITATAQTMNAAIAGQVFSGLGAGLNELIALAATAEMVPVRKRGIYVGMIVFTIIPFCPSVLWAQLISRDSNWRMNGALVCIWNFIGLILVAFCYKDPPRILEVSRKRILKDVDYIGGFLSTAGVLCFMMGMQWGAQQYKWGSAQVLAPFILGIVLIISFFVWEVRFAKHPMAPPRLFRKARRTMILILLITFLSGANFFVLLLFWPTQIFNVYGNDPVGIGLRSLPIGFGIIAGAFISLFLIPITKGRITAIMIFFTALMTAGCGAVSVGTTHNLPVMYVIVTLASLGVGGVIIPSSIIAQICCDDDLIATITAITLSIRYVGGAIGFTAYYNVFYHKFVKYATLEVAIKTIVFGQIVSPQHIPFITELVTLLGNAQFKQLHHLLLTSPLILSTDKEKAYQLIVASGQQAFAKAYRWPYWMSISFGGICFIMAFFLGDIKRFLTDAIAAPQAGTVVEHHRSHKKDVEAAPRVDDAPAVKEEEKKEEAAAAVH